jgi:hypothetical protein
MCAVRAAAAAIHNYGSYPVVVFRPFHLRFGKCGSILGVFGNWRFGVAPPLRALMVAAVLRPYLLIFFQP